MQLVSGKNDIQSRKRGIIVSELVTKYINNIKSMRNSTAQHYKSILGDFANFAYKTYGYNIDNLIQRFLSDHDLRTLIESMIPIVSKFRLNVLLES